MIYIKIYFLISFIIICSVVGATLFFVDYELWILRIIFASLIISAPISIIIRIIFGKKIDEVFRRDN